MESTGKRDYLQVDDSWDVIYGIKSFTEYVERFVVKGRFNPHVPKDVREAFVLAEYMMAHSYHHYPLYDEALSKVLRIIEMAVKFRCKELGIETEQFNPRWNRTVERNLSKLMEQLALTEPHKDLKHSFDSARTLRNSIMHPKHHSFSGAMSNGYLQHSVNMLNRIFIKDTYFKRCEEQLTSVNDAIQSFHSGLSVLSLDDGFSAFYNLQVEAVAKLDGDWQYLFTAWPVLFQDTAKELEEHSYRFLPLIIEGVKLKTTNDAIELTDANRKQYVFQKTTDVFIDEVYHSYLKSFEQASENDQIFYTMHMRGEINKADNAFWYNRLHLIDE